MRDSDDVLKSLPMARIPNWLKVTVSTCGGWFGTMSGAVSIPFTCLAIFCTGKQQIAFVILAIVALYVFASGLVRHNLQLQKALVDQSSEHKIASARLTDEFNKREDELKRQLDDREKIREKEIDFKLAKHGLGIVRGNLDVRIAEIREMGYYDYNKKYESVEYDKYDPDTAAVIENINLFLQKHFSMAEAQYFVSKEGIQMHSVDHWDREKYQRVLDNLHHHAKQLDKIIEKHI